MTANVALTDTFDQWRVKTNEVLAGTQSTGMSNTLKTTDTTNSTSNTTGSIITAGGVGISKSAHIGGDLKVWGDVTTVGDTTISGNLTFGDASTDQVTFSADINSSMIPNANLTFNLGNTTQQWANAWVGHAGITQKTDSGKPALSVTSTDTNVIAIDIDASQIDADVIDIAADVVTTAKVIDITSDALTTGSVLYIDSDSSSTGTRNIASITQNHASAVGATALAVVADAGRGLFIDSNLAAGGYALEVDAEITTTNTAKIAAISTSGTTLEIASAGVLTGKVIDITADAATTGTGINMSMDGLTTGSALAIDSDSSSTGTRNIASIIQNHSSASGSTTLYLQQDHATADALKVVGAVTVGVDDTGHDVKFFGATSGKSLFWDESADTLTVTGTTTLVGTTNLDAVQFDGALTVGVDDTGYDVKLFGATAGSFMLWNQATDSLHLTDDSPIKVGDAQDMTLYHNGTDSYITNSQGIMKIATESSGIAVTIGHTTSVVTIGDNLTVTDTITESSMREMKDNIEPIENILPAVMQMQGVTFDWKKDKDNDKRSNHYGFIAEDVNEVLPGLVSYSPDGKPMGIQYSKMTAVLLEAIKEQQVQIDELKSMLN